jgi:hypothetical protein
MSADNSGRRVLRLTAASLIGVVAVVAIASVALSAAGSNDVSDAAIAREQQQITDHYASLADVSPAEKPSNPESAGPSPTIDSAWEQGLTKNPEYPGPGYVLTTEWVSSSETTNTAVYAGSSVDNGQRGLILVVTEDRNTYDTESKAFPAPDGIGPLTITGGTDTTVNLQDAKGQSIQFDLSTSDYK